MLLMQNAEALAKGIDTWYGGVFEDISITMVGYENYFIDYDVKDAGPDHVGPWYVTAKGTSTKRVYGFNEVSQAHAAFVDEIINGVRKSGYPEMPWYDYEMA